MVILSTEGSTIPLVPQRMRNFDEVAKSLSRFVNPRTQL
jgi:hypothetical protein